MATTTNGRLILTTTIRGHQVDAIAPDVRYRRWHQLFVSGQPRDEGILRVGTWGPDADSEIVRVATGEPYAWRAEDRGGRIGVFGSVLGGIVLAEDDPDAAALVAESRELDRAWEGANRAAIAHEDRTQGLVAHAVACQDQPRAAFDGPTECLECGATFDDPGQVEPGGMGCTRCNH